MKTPIRKLNSSKLFYSKWPFKVECLLPGASRIIHAGPALIRSWCVYGNGMYVSPHDLKRIDKVALLAFTDAVEQFIGRNDVKIRVEGSHFNLFCSDYTILADIDAQLHQWIKKISGPTSKEEYDFLMSNGHKKILCENLPHEKYKYRIYFKSKFPADKRLSFVSWADKYGEKIEISETSRRWLLGSRHWAQDPFMYVDDDKMLSMAGIYLSGYVKKVEEFIPRSIVLAP